MKSEPHNAEPQEKATPFWYHLRQTWLYPLNRDPLIVILIAALLHTALALFLQVVWMFAMFAFAFQLMILSYVYRYGSAIVVHTAGGNLEPPENIMPFGERTGWDQIKLLITFIALGLVATLWLPSPLDWLIPIALLCGYPMASIVLAINQGGILTALNPLLWIQGASRIGWSYFGIVLLTLAFAFSYRYLGGYLKVLPWILAHFLSIALSYYFALMSFYLLGYAVYQYKDELGFEQTSSPAALPKLPPARPDPDQELLSECEAMVQAGHLEQAAQRLGRHLKMAGGSALVHERYRKVLGVLGDQKALLEHTQLWLAVLLAQEKWPEAAALYQTQVTAQPEFAPQDAELWAPLAKALEAKHADLAIQLLQKYHLNFPRSKHISKHWLQAAQILVRKKHNYVAGCNMIKQIRARFPDSSIAEELNRQEAEWAKLSGV